MKNVPVITIDGTSGVGKGTLGLRLCQWLGFHFLDSGALYRILGLLRLRQNIEPEDPTLVDMAKNLPVVFEQGHIYLLPEREDISQVIRNETIAQSASEIAVIPKIRKA